MLQSLGLQRVRHNGVTEQQFGERSRSQIKNGRNRKGRTRSRLRKTGIGRTGEAPRVMSSVLLG